MSDGGLVKLQIQAYKEITYGKDNIINGLMFEAMFNPTTFSRKLEIEYEDAQAKGTSSTTKKFSKVNPGSFDLELLIDGTGTSGPLISVQEKIDLFIKVCAEYYGEFHRPNYLMISWVKMNLKAVMTNVDVAYSLFKPDGTPLRAKITASFAETLDEKYRVNNEKNSSPDLTHYREVKEGDTLPLMVKRIYGNSKYYLQVAEANGIKNFRNLEPGTTIFFPPIEKK